MNDGALDTIVAMITDRLGRLEDKIDKLVEDVAALKRPRFGLRSLAASVGAAIGVLVHFFWRGHGG